VTPPPRARVDARQWLRLKDHLADLAELAPADRAAALAALELDDEDQRALVTMVAALDPTDQRLRPSQPAEPRAGLSTLRWQVGERVHGYVVDGFLGRGGMGEVYAAHAEAGGEKVALKVLRLGLEHSGLDHFVGNEQRALKRLDDPHIARFIETFELPDHGLCLVLEQIEGEPLMDWCVRRRLDIGARLALFEQVCSAVASAHQQLVVHRDLKPANVLIDAAGRVKLLDFGIAKLLDDEGSATQTHGGLYTLAYAAPEQVLRAPVSTATDIYALGVLLFHLLTGASPYAVGANESLVKAVLSDRPRALTSAVEAAAALQTLDHDLDRVIARAMEKDPRDRYRSVVELAADVRAVRTGMPISAGGGRVYRLRKFVRRHPAGVAMSVVLGLTLLAATAVSLHWARRAEQEARVAAAESRRASAVADFLVGLFQVSDPGVNRGDRLTANQILERGADNLAAKFADQPLQRARLQLVTGDVYVAMGEYARARSVLEPALATLRQDSGASTDETVHALRQLAQVASRQAAFAEAIELATAGETMLADAGLTTSGERVQLALVRSRAHYDLGQLPQAADALDAARKAAAQIPAPDLQLEAAIHAASADLADESGDFELARSEYQQALRKFSRAIGDNHYRTVAVRTNLGALLVTKFDDFDGAEPLLEQALAQWQRLRGPDSAAYASTANTLGELFRHRGQHDRATALFRDSERAYRAALGERHPSITWPITNHGKSLADQGDYAAALAEYERAQAVVVQGLPATEMRSNQIRKQMVDVLIPLRRYEQARALATEALALSRARLPADHPEIVNTLYQLGFAYYGLGDKAAADVHWREALERAPRAFAHLPRALADMRAEIADPEAVLREHRERKTGSEYISAPTRR
jgi:serine/threonine-protein kinase